MESFAVADRPSLDIGQLVNNNVVVESARGAMVGGQRAESLVPMTIEELIEEGAWRDRMDMNGRRFTYGPGEFSRFIEDPAPGGLETTKEAIRKYLGDSSNPLRVRFEELAEGGPGGCRVGHPNAMRNEGGQFTVIHPDEDDATAIPNNIRNGGVPGDSKPRDRSREPQAGTSVGYIVRRLTRAAEADPDGPAAQAYERLLAGEITTNAAAILAGFWSKPITIPSDPRAAARRLVRHFTREQFDVLAACMLAEYERDGEVAEPAPTGDH